MKKCLIQTAILTGVLILSASCVKEPVDQKQTQTEAETVQQGRVRYFTKEPIYTVDGSKTVKTDSGLVLWEEGDVLAVRSTKPPYKVYELILNPATAGQPIGEFIEDPVIPDSEYPLALIYPASAMSQKYGVLSAGDVPIFFVNASGRQQYRKNSPAKDVMLATAYLEDSSYEEMNIINLEGLLKLTLKGNVAVTEITLCVSKESRFLSGEDLGVPCRFAENPGAFENIGLINITSGGDPISTLSYQVVLDCSNGGNGVQLTSDGVDFYFALPAKSLDCPFAVYVETKDNFLMYRTANHPTQNTVFLSEITSMPPLPFKKTIPMLPGVYNLAGGDIVKIAAFEGGMSQYGVDYLSEQLYNHRIANWTAGYEIDLQTPAVPQYGQNYTINVSSFGSCPAAVSTGNKNTTCVFTDNYYGYWLVDNTNNIGYLVKK